MTRYSCAICGAKREREALIFSRFTRHYYCGPRLEKACARRASKKVKS